jgi:hypothetical protein
MGRILGLDVSTKTIGVALFEDEGEKGRLLTLTHVTPNIKPRPTDSYELLLKKSKTFATEFLEKYSDYDIDTVIIEEPLMRSNNANTVATLGKFNGMISLWCYEILGVVPVFISSYDARKYGFPELMEIRTHNKKGEKYSEKELSKKKPVLFGGYSYDVDKKMVIWEKVNDLEPQIVWFYDKKVKLKKENFDMTDAYCCVLGWMRKEKRWK